MHRLVLDTDVGIDDALMLIHLIAEPSVEIVAIGSTHGNCSSAQGAINALRVLEALDRTGIPVAVGNESPVPGATHSWHVHGHDGLGDAGLPLPVGTPTDEGAVAQIVRLAKERPGELTLVAVGTMTNLAAALALDPDCLGRYKEVWILGAISHRPVDGEREMFDANVYNSPDAADALFASDAKITVVPIDTSYRSIIQPELRDRIWAADTPAARLCQAILPCYFNFYQERIGFWSCCAHDPTVSLALVHPELIVAEDSRPLIVEPFKNRHHGVGLTTTDPGFPLDRMHFRIITGLDVQASIERLLQAIECPLGSLHAQLSL
jgi:purine nucleosidase